MSVNGKIVFITGASSGIGAATALAFAAEGARLLLAARRADKLAEVASLALMRGAPAVRTVDLDVRNHAAVQDTVDALPKEWAEIDILVNNAGLSRGLDKLYAGKIAEHSINDGLRQDLLGTPVRVTSIDPGMVETDFSLVRFHGDEERAAKVYKGLTPLTPEDVADAIVWAASRPAHVNIARVSMTSIHQANSLLFHREG